MTWVVSLISSAVGMAETAISFKICFMSYIVDSYVKITFTSYVGAYVSALYDPRLLSTVSRIFWANGSAPPPPLLAKNCLYAYALVFGFGPQFLEGYLCRGLAIPQGLASLYHNSIPNKNG